VVGKMATFNVSEEIKMYREDKIIIKDVAKGNILDLCLVCVPPEKSNDMDWQKGVEEKRLWAIDILQKWGLIAKIAYYDDSLAGMIQYRPVPEEKIVSIDCIYVSQKEHWQKGIGTRLLENLIEEMKKPQKWFKNQPASALVVRTFPGESEGQISAQEFFARKGFKQVGKSKSFLYYPIKENFVYQPVEKESPAYVSQSEDKGKVLIFCGPNKCPAAYPFFLKRMEKYIREIDHTIPIIYVDISREPEKTQTRNAGYGDCIVNARFINAFVLDKENFQREVKEAIRDK